MTNRDEMEYVDAMLLLASDSLDDIERTRIAAGNRLAALDRKGIQDGNALTGATGLHTALLELEHQATLNLQRTVREHYLGTWIRRTVGIGEKQGGRLIGALGNPRWNYAEQRARRGPAELWAYCGYHVIDGAAPARRRGQRANWNGNAKMRAFLCAESAIKQAHSPFRSVYDAARRKHEDAVHQGPCVRCGPAGHPAATETPLSAGHQHARRLREVAKEILKDMYLAAPVLD